MHSTSSRGSYAWNRKDNTITAIQWQRQQSRGESTTDGLVDWEKSSILSDLTLENPWDIGHLKPINYNNRNINKKWNGI